MRALPRFCTLFVLLSIKNALIYCGKEKMSYLCIANILPCLNKTNQ